MAGPTTPDAGPDFAPPSLPPGWIAQWDGKSRKYYFVQLSTGESTWEVPTHAAPQVPTPGATPAQESSPFKMPENESSRGYGQEGGEGERGLGTDLLRMAMGGKQSQSQGGLVSGLAQSFLGGSSSSNTHQQSSSSGLGGLAQSFLGSGSSSNSHSNSQGGGYNPNQSQSSSGGGIMGQLGGLLGGSHGKQSDQNFGYSSNGHTGTYTGTAPPTSYQPPGSSGQSYKPSSGSYNLQSSVTQPQGESYAQHSGSTYNSSNPQYSSSSGGQFGSQQYSSTSAGQYGASTPSHNSQQAQVGYGQPQGGYLQQSNVQGGSSIPQSYNSAGAYGASDYQHRPPPSSFDHGPPGSFGPSGGQGAPTSYGAPGGQGPPNNYATPGGQGPPGSFGAPGGPPAYPNNQHQDGYSSRPPQGYGQPGSGFPGQSYHNNHSSGPSW